MFTSRWRKHHIWHDACNTGAKLFAYANQEVLTNEEGQGLCPWTPLGP